MRTNSHHVARFLGGPGIGTLAIIDNSLAANYDGGLQHAFENALLAMGFAKPASAFMPAGEFAALAGAGDGTRYQSLGIRGGSPGAAFTTTGAGSTFDAALPSADSSLWAYHHLASPANHTTGNTLGVIRPTGAALAFGTSGAVGGNPLGVSGLRVRLWFGRFNTGGGEFSLRHTVPTTAMAADVSCVSGGSDEIVSVTYDMADLTDIADSAIQTAWNASSNILGNAVFLGWSVEQPSRTTGIVCSPWHRVGATTAAGVLDATAGTLGKQPEAYFHHQFNFLTAPQVMAADGGARRRLLVPVGFGMNEKTPSDIKAAWKADIQGFITKCQAYWASWMGGTQDPADLVIDLVPNHPHETLSAQQDQFYAAARELASENTNVSAADLKAWNPASVFTERGYYRTADPAHLKVIGSQAIAEFLLDVRGGTRDPRGTGNMGPRNSRAGR